MNDELFTFILDNGEEQDCTWLTWRNDDERIERYCSRGDVNGGCQESCNSCPCKDDPSYTFELDNKNILPCEWFGWNNSEERRARYCYETDGITVSTTGHHCLDNCGFCASMVPSSTPTGMPSKKPSAQPVAHPSSTPSVSPHPSAQPGAHPSSTPSVSPRPSANPTLSMKPSAHPSANPTISMEPTAPGCMDDPDFEFTIDIGVTNDCTWLTKNNESVRKAEYCGRGHVKGACQYTCGSCNTCEDDEDFEFYLNNENLQKCAWFTRNNSMDTIDNRRNNYCYEEDGESSSDIGDVCISACGFCN